MKKSDKSKKDVEAYIESLPEDARHALIQLRQTIRKTAPDAEEGFSYGVPAFRIKGKPLVCYAAFKNHCGFYPMSPGVLNQFIQQLSEYETAKGTIRFHPRKTIPEILIKKIVEARLEEFRK